MPVDRLRGLVCHTPTRRREHLATLSSALTPADAYSTHTPVSTRVQGEASCTTDRPYRIPRRTTPVRNLANSVDHHRSHVLARTRPSPSMATAPLDTLLLELTRTPLQFLRCYTTARHAMHLTHCALTIAPTDTPHDTRMAHAWHTHGTCTPLRQLSSTPSARTNNTRAHALTRTRPECYMTWTRSAYRGRQATAANRARIGPPPFGDSAAPPFVATPPS